MLVLERDFNLSSDIHVYYMQSQMDYARQLHERIRRECES